MKNEIFEGEQAQIRAFKREDSGAVCALNRLLGPGSAATPAFFTAHCLGSGALAKGWVAEVSGKIAGFGMAHDFVSFGAGGKIRQIDLLFVAEKFRGAGIGTALIEKISQDAKKSKCIRIDIEVEEKNKIARNLYASLNYESDSAKKLRYKKYLK